LWPSFTAGTAVAAVREKRKVRMVVERKSFMVVDGVEFVDWILFPQ
jgi:hypothetical protein